MNPYDKSLNLTETTSLIKTNRRGAARIIDLVDDAFAKGLASRFDSFAEMIEAAEAVGFETQGLRDYLRDQEIIVQTTGPSVFVAAILKSGATIGGKRVLDYTIATLRDELGGLVFIVFMVATKAEYAAALRLVEPLEMTEADMEEIRQHMIVCPDTSRCPTFATQMAINAGIEMMAIAAGGRS